MDGFQIYRFSGLMVKSLNSPVSRTWEFNANTHFFLVKVIHSPKCIIKSNTIVRLNLPWTECRWSMIVIRVAMLTFVDVWLCAEVSGADGRCMALCVPQSGHRVMLQAGMSCEQIVCQVTVFIHQKAIDKLRWLGERLIIIFISSHKIAMSTIRLWLLQFVTNIKIVDFIKTVLKL